MGIGDSYVLNGQVRASDAEVREHEEEMYAKRTISLPLNMQERLDYGVRTDGQPTYIGYAPRALATSATGWMLAKFTYDDNGYVTVKQIAYDSWDNRAGATYA